MRRIDNDLDMITAVTDVKGKRMIDIGCGTGDLVRQLTEAGAIVSGIDTAEVIEKAKQFPTAGSETYLEGGGETLPFPDDFADVILFFASIHHVPETKMDQALAETRRVLKPDGLAIIIEPVATPGSYTELIRLVEDEEHIQKLASDAINRASMSGFVLKTEDMLYFERSLQDYKVLLDKYVEDEEKRSEYYSEAKKITEGLSREAGVSTDEFRFKSICRMQVLKT